MVDFRFTWFDFSCQIVSIIVFIADVVTDGIVAHKYFTEKDYVSFGITVGFVGAQSLLSFIYSCVLYCREGGKFTAGGCCGTFWRTIFLLLQLDPVFRNIEILILGYRYGKEKDGQKAQSICEKLLRLERDGLQLRLLEAFVEAAPLLIFQLIKLWGQYANNTMASNTTVQLNTTIPSATSRLYMYFTIALPYLPTIIASLFSLAWALTAFNRSSRYCNSGKKNLKFFESVAYFLWRLFETGSRVLLFALFISEFTYSFIGFAVPHLVPTGIWLWCYRNNCQSQAVTCTCSLKCLSDFIACLLHLFLLYFCFFKANSDDRYRYRGTCYCPYYKMGFVYYFIIFIEDAILLVIWWLAGKQSQQTHSTELRHDVIIAVAAGFGLSLVFWAFYECFHRCCGGSAAHSRKHVPRCSLQ